MSWKTRKLGELVEAYSVRAKNNGGSSNLPFLGVSNEIGITISKYAAEDKAEEYKHIEKGCFAYNPYRINVGSIAYLNEDIEGLISPAYVVFKPKKNAIKPELLLKFLKSAEGLRQIKLHARGTVRQALRFEDLCKIELHLPDYEEQEFLFNKINSVKQEADKLKHELNSQQNILKQLRQAFLREAMQGKLVQQDPKDGNAADLLQQIKAEKAKSGKKEKPLPPIKDEEIPFAIPDNWVWCRFGEIAFIANGNTPSQDAFLNGEVPYFKVYNIKNQKIDFQHRPQFIKREVHEKQLKRSIGYPNDILMNIVGPPLGKLAIIPNEFPECNFNQAIVLIRPLAQISHQYIFWCLNEMSEINAIATKGVAGQDNISITQTNNMKLPLPPLAEQHRILKKLESLMQYCDALQQSIQQSRQQTEKLLQQVLREALQQEEAADALA